jgi:predicted ATP-dependent serine protease
MALIRCSECNHEVSDKAVKCVSCGNPDILFAPKVPKIMNNSEIKKTFNHTSSQCKNTSHLNTSTDKTFNTQSNSKELFGCLGIAIAIIGIVLIVLGIAYVPFIGIPALSLLLIAQAVSRFGK